MDIFLSFWPLLQQLRKGRFVDLTHPFDAAIPRFESAKAMHMDEICSYEKEGFQVQYFQFEGQWGTHVDAPSHLAQGKRTLDQIPLEEMVLPLVVIDICEKIVHNPDYIVLVDDLIEWEEQHGRIPQNAFVALRTDWSKRWPNDAAMHNRDAASQPHAPGWGLDALCYLFEDCQITATGQETLDSDPAFRAKETNWVCQRYISEQNRYQIELLANLDQCPATGAIAICSFPKPIGASGFPARIFAICPAS